MCIKNMLEEFKNIKYEDISCKTWYESVKLMNTNKKFSVYFKKINDNTTHFGSILLAFYSKEDNDIIISIDDNQIKQKIPSKILTYPICNIILTKIARYSDINIHSSKEIYGIFITLTDEELNNIDNYIYFSNYFYGDSEYHLYYHSGKIYLEDGLYEKTSINEFEIPNFTNEKIIHKNI